MACSYAGEYDDLPEAAFYMVGNISEVQVGLNDERINLCANYLPRLYLPRQLMGPALFVFVDVFSVVFS